MIYFIILAASALLLNIIGRILILRKDTEAGDGWRRSLKLCPGADVIHLLLRWQHARLGGLLCALSLAAAAPVANQLIRGKQLEKFSLSETLRDMTEVKRATSETPVDQSALRKRATVKEKQLAELNVYLQSWFTSLTARKNALPADAPLEVAEYNRMAAAYQNLMQVWKQEQQALNQMKAQL